MKIVKTKFRSRLTDKYLRDQLRLADNYNALHIAAMHSREDIVKILLAKKGVDPFAAGGPRMQTAVHLVASRQTGTATSILRLLLNTAGKEIRLKPDSAFHKRTAMLELTYGRLNLSTLCKFDSITDRKRNEEILEQLEVESVEEKITRYKFNWLDHVRRMENSRIPKIMMQYKPRGHRRPGRSLRRLLDGAETGLQRPNS
ncbi:hypothetical protein ANN_09010 [Periplaneta americana]|uniref:Uncharacterized protein n=1 Tax=Periplaneta americana TaxID=6978 RepID=A0ABQ8TLY9_PERAM|nr:hypothetical protein ANN_09010 [Periplaneta americana]